MDDVVIERVQNTTSGQPGFQTLKTGKRLFGQQTNEQGAGLVNAERFVAGIETSVADVGDAMTFGAGVAGLSVVTATSPTD
jgi:hypothetical protein